MAVALKIRNNRLKFEYVLFIQNYIVQYLDIQKVKNKYIYLFKFPTKCAL